MKKALSLILALMLCFGLLAACDSQGKQEETPNQVDEPQADTQEPAEESEDKPGDTGIIAGVDNDLPAEVEGEIDETKVLTTLIDCDASPAFNGNPFDDTAGANWSIQPFLFDYLAFFAPYPERQFKLSLLEDYTYEDKVLTMKLKEGLKWSDGSVLDAEDLMVHFYMQVGRNQIWRYINTIEKLDDLSVKLEFCEESPLLLNIAFRAAVMTPDEIYRDWAEQYKDVADNHREFLEEENIWQYDDKANEILGKINEDVLTFKPAPEDIIACGPYIIETWNTSEVLFVENPEYRKEMKIKKIRGLRPGDAQAFSTAILSNEYTIENGGLSIDMSDQIDKNFQETMRKFFVPELSQIGYSLNTLVYPLSVPEVRKAMAYAVDKHALVSVAEPGSFEGDKYNTGLLPSLRDAYLTPELEQELVDYSYNPDEAARLLESIGWTKQGNQWVDENGEAPVIEIATINSWPSFMLTAEAMSTMLKDFGFNIDFKPMEFGVWNEYTKDDENKMVGCTFLGASPTYAHPWESFNDYFITNPRSAFGTLPVGEDRMLTRPSDGVEVNISKLQNDLFEEEDPAKAQEIVAELLRTGNDLCAFISVIEKTAPFRIYDPKLNLGGGVELNDVQNNYYYYGNINNIIVKLLQDDLIYFVK